MSNPKFMVLPEGYIIWTKKLGQRHYAKAGFSSETLCGIPMLGNNYAYIISISDQTECKVCAELLEKQASCPRCGTVFVTKPGGKSCPKCGTFVPERTEYEPTILPEKSYSYAELEFRIRTCQDADMLKKILHKLETSTEFTEFDKELLKEEILQRIQRILEAEEYTKPGSPDKFAEDDIEYLSFMERTWDKEKRGKQKEILRKLYSDYDPKRHDSFVDRYNKEVDKKRLDKYIEARKIADPGQKQLNDNFTPPESKKKDNKTPLELAREERLKQYPTVEAFRSAKTKHADFLESDFHLKSHKTKAEMYKPGSIQYNKHMVLYNERLKEIADLRKEAAAGKTLLEMRLEEQERDIQEYQAEREAHEQKMNNLRSESYESLLEKAKSFNVIWGDENKAWKDRYKAKDEVKDIISILKERNIDIIPILNNQLHELQAKNKVKEHNMTYRIGDPDDELDDIPPAEDIKSWAIWAEIVDYVMKNGLKKWMDTEYAAHLEGMTAEELKLLHKIIEGTDDLTVSERVKIQEKIEQRLKPPMRDKDISKMSYAELHFLINTEQDTDELKRLHSLINTLTITEFDKELLKEEAIQRMQRIIEAEESAKPGGPAPKFAEGATSYVSEQKQLEAFRIAKYRIGDSGTTYNIDDIEDIKRIKLAAACGVKKIWINNKGREGLILTAKYGREWWEKASRDDIERITVYETNTDYKLSDRYGKRVTSIQLKTSVYNRLMNIGTMRDTFNTVLSKLLDCYEDAPEVKQYLKAANILSKNEFTIKEDEGTDPITTIQVEPEIVQRISYLGRKNDTYSSIINRMLDVSCEKKILNQRGMTGRVDVIKETDDEIIQTIKKEQGDIKGLKCTTIKAFHKPGYTLVVMKPYLEGENIGSVTLYDINFKLEGSAKRLEAKLKELFKSDYVKESGVDLELSIVETNLLNVGYDLRNDGRGHMVLPNGKGVSPTNHRGIVNHWEVIVDAGYLPSSNIFKLKHSPDSIVAGAINKGWRRWAGEASYEIRDLSKPNADFINMRLKQHFESSGGMYEAHIDIWSEGKYYNFNKKTWDSSNHDILQVIKKITPKSYHPSKAMDLKLMEVKNEYLIRDPATIGDPDKWIASKGAAFMDDIRGAHHGQVDGTLIAYDINTRTTIGYIDYSLFQNKVYINGIEVGPAHRRQGYATALVLKLKKLNPGLPVKWGMMTEAGCALKSTVDAESQDNQEGIKVYYMGVLEEKNKYEKDCTDWDFGTFEAMLAGMESDDELDSMLDCLNASKILSDPEIKNLREIINKKMEG